MYKDPPIAWLQLRAQKPQSFAALVSIAFITILLFMQVGFRAAFLDALQEIPKRLQGDLYLMSASTLTLLFPQPFSQHRLYQIPAFEEVEAVVPIYFQETHIADPTGNQKFLYHVGVIGFPPIRSPLDIPAVNSQLHLLKEGEVFLFDERSRTDFQPIVREVAERGGMNIMVQPRGQKELNIIKVKGLFPLGISELRHASLLTSDSTFFQVFGGSREVINIGVIYLKPGSDLVGLQKTLNELLPDDVTIKNKQQILEDERFLFEFGMPLGVVFRVAMASSVLIGIVVLYQILFQLTSTYVRDYATLKALGFSHFMVMRIVIAQALMLGMVGFLLGVGGSFFLYDKMTDWMGMDLTMTNFIMAAVFVLVNLICLISAIFAVRKLREADPADMFG